MRFSLKCFEEYDVKELVVDPMGWHNEITELEEIVGDNMVLIIKETLEKMAQACSRFIQQHRTRLVIQEI